MQIGRVFLNARMAVLQVVAMGLVLFVLYKFLLIAIGVELIGVWSLVMATSGLLNIGNFAFAGSVVKFVAKYIALQDRGAAAEVVETAAISLGSFFLVLLAILYPAIEVLLRNGLPSAHATAAESLLPFAVFSLWVNAVGGVYQGGLDGCQRIDLRSVLVVGAGIVNFLLIVLFVNEFGFIGLGYAQALQSAVMLIAMWSALRSQIRALSVVLLRWRWKYFIEMLKYGVNLQISSVASIVVEPITKWLISSFGGLTMTGYYEMASRMVAQLRSVPVAANQVMVPVIAGMNETDPHRRKPVYLASLRLMLYLAIPYFAAGIMSVPLISELWIGRYEQEFIWFAAISFSGAFFLAVNAPAYFFNLGGGRLRWNTVAHVSITALTAAFGYTLGSTYGGIGVAMGAAAAQLVGSGIVIVAFHIEERVSICDVKPREFVWLAAAAPLGVAIGLLAYNTLHESLIIASIVMMAGFLLVVIPVLWAHPLARSLKRWTRGA